MSGPPAKPLTEKVRDWFESEGYPLEFRVARAFEQNRFDAKQGHYIVDETENQAREIDVVADIDADLEGGGFFRVSHVIECKWSQDKPWVVFTSPQSIMAESACVAQTAGSLLGEAVMFCVAGERSLHPLGMFKRPERGGFSGRRAFEKQDKDKYDQFYRTMQGVANAAAAQARRFGRSKPRDHEVPRDGNIVFPVVVVDANLFEAFYDPQGDLVRVSEVDRLRIFWRGLRAKRTSITTIDIVTANVVADFARTRASEIDQLLTAVEQAVRKIKTAFAEQSFKKLEITPAPRGFTGLPPLLLDLYMLEQTGKTSPQLNQ